MIAGAPAGAKDCTPEIDTSEIIVEFRFCDFWCVICCPDSSFCCRVRAGGGMILEKGGGPEGAVGLSQWHRTSLQARGPQQFPKLGPMK